MEQVVSNVTFADVVHPSLSFSREIPSEALLLELIDNRWMQRLREIVQTANARLLYMFSEHSRFGHSLGVAYLASQLLRRLETDYPERVKPYRLAVSAAALLHDIGHLSPGSHTAFKVWFPGGKDAHEELAARIICEDSELHALLENSRRGLAAEVCAVLAESPDLPAWTWEIISGGGWNVDRGNWCIADSVMAGVNYGKYNIPALTESILLSPDGHLALKENRLDAMMHFAVSRHAMYSQIYQHRVLLAADALSAAIAKRARFLGEKLGFADHTMQQALHAGSVRDLTLESVFWMRESWWRYHVLRWSDNGDAILSDLCRRLINRRLFKTVKVSAEDCRDLQQRAETAVRACGLDPEYYLHRISAADVHAGDQKHSMPVMLDDGRLCPVHEVDPLFNALFDENRAARSAWLALPEEAKLRLGLRR